MSRNRGRVLFFINKLFYREKEAYHEVHLRLQCLDYRNKQNLTQKELSQRTGITQADISRIEKGTRNPSLNMLKRLAEGLGMRLKLEHK